jgi:hypothetical protein
MSPTDYESPSFQQKTEIDSEVSLAFLSVQFQVFKEISAMKKNIVNH